MAVCNIPPQAYIVERAKAPCIEINAHSEHVNIFDYTNKPCKRNSPHGRCTKNAREQKKRRLNIATQKHNPRPIDSQPFRFLDLPRELRDQIYSYLTARQDVSSSTTLDACSVLKEQKKRTISQASRDRLNQKRLICGKPLVRARVVATQPLVFLNIMAVSRLLHYEASNMFYSNNYFSITLEKLPLTTFEVPYGWDLSRITRLRIELQLKDATRMNKYVDWDALFSVFTSLRFLRLVPTFHSRYYDWAHAELEDWSTTPFVHKAFVRNLLDGIPRNVDFKLGWAPDALHELQCEKKVVSKAWLKNMYTELSTNSRCFGQFLKVEHVVD